MPKEQCIGFNHLHVVDADHVLMVRIGWQPGYDSLTARDSRGPDCWRAEVRCVPADDHGAGCVPRHSPVDRHWSHWYPMRLKFRRRVCVFRNVWMASFRFSRIFCKRSKFLAYRKRRWGSSSLRWNATFDFNFATLTMESFPGIYEYGARIELVSVAYMETKCYMLIFWR